MPLIKSAIKKMRVDARRRVVNQAKLSALRSTIKKARTDLTFESVSAAYSALDRAVKLNLIHRNFANRNKSQLGKLAKPTAAKVEAKVKKLAPKKAVAKKVSAKKTVKKTVKA